MWWVKSAGSRGTPGRSSCIACTPAMTFVGLDDRCAQRALLAAHGRALASVGGVPPRRASATLTPAGRQLGGAERMLPERFAALATHALCAPCFARPGAGHDKGGGESRGKAIRLQPLTPLPSGATLKASAEATRTEGASARRPTGATRGQTGWERCPEERPPFRALPSVACAARHTQSLLGKHRALGQIAGATDAGPSTWGGRTIPAALGVAESCLGWQGEPHV